MGVQKSQTWLSDWTTATTILLLCMCYSHSAKFREVHEDLLGFLSTKLLLFHYFTLEITCASVSDFSPLSERPVFCLDYSFLYRKCLQAENWKIAGLTLFVPLYQGSLSCVASSSVTEINHSRSLSSFPVVCYKKLAILPVTPLWLKQSWHYSF